LSLLAIHSQFHHHGNGQSIKINATVSLILLFIINLSKCHIDVQYMWLYMFELYINYLIFKVQKLTRQGWSHVEPASTTCISRSC
jgi:hypothetical protein